MVRRAAVCAIILLSLLASSAAWAKDFVVVIDAGHGGNDPGAVGRFAQEKKINLAIALKLGELIKNQMGGTKVVYTRSTDIFLPLTDRARIANRNDADLFISIHTNAVENRANSPQGVETYSLGLHRSAANLAVAKRENAAILLEKDYKERYAGFNPNSLESYIIFEFMQDKFMEQSVKFAALVQQYARSHAGRPDKGVKQAGFLVLRETSMPSVLVEVGFISHAEEERYLASEAGTTALSQSIFRAFRDYKADYDRKAGITTTIREVETAQSTVPQTTTESTPTASQSTSEGTAQPVFKVQILSSSASIKATDKRFRGWSPIESYQEAGLYKYTHGADTDYNKIAQLRRQMLKDFPEAFVIAFGDGKRMDVQEAIRIFKDNNK